MYCAMTLQNSLPTGDNTVSQWSSVTSAQLIIVQSPNIPRKDVSIFEKSWPSSAHPNCNLSLVYLNADPYAD